MDYVPSAQQQCISPSCGPDRLNRTGAAEKGGKMDVENSGKFMSIELYGSLWNLFPTAVRSTAGFGIGEKGEILHVLDAVMLHKMAF